jgi:hypothetical protein
MTGLLAFVAFVLATIVFGLDAFTVSSDIRTLPWGGFFVSLGLALLALGPGVAYVNAKRAA